MQQIIGSAANPTHSNGVLENLLSQEFDRDRSAY